MVFSSTTFLFFYFPVTVAGYFLIKDSWRNYWLLLASIFFFAWSQPRYTVLILASILLNYLGALLISRLEKGRKLLLAAVILANLGILFYYKYLHFALGSISRLFRIQIPLPDILLPIGISFFTFQGMSYVIDVYRKDVTVQKDISKVALYITFFPQLIAGPIVRYRDMERDIIKRSVSLDDLSYGTQRFICGLAKKVILSNTLAGLTDTIWSLGAAQHSPDIAWMTSIAYSLHIYFDFSGYSDMAIGLGRIFGFHLCENFNLPYTAKSISEFWRRWHISLSSWFRDYVYIPLGGNRRNVCRNLGIVFLLTGIWHGASWHFIIWGCWHGFFIISERIMKQRLPKIKIPRPLLHIYTLFIVNAGWVLFRAPNLRSSLQFIKCMLGRPGGLVTDNSFFWYADRWVIFVMICGIFFSSSLPGLLAEFIRKKTGEKLFSLFKYAALTGLLFFSVMRVVSGTYNPFIYFQF